MTGTVRLYHGSRAGLSGAIAPLSRNACDFGCGFYMGDDSHQPLTLICDDENPVLYTLDFKLDGLNVVEFQPDLDWALFVAFNRGRMERYADTPFYRRYQEIRKSADAIYGKIANDRIYYVLNRFFDRLFTDAVMLESLKALNLGNQFCAITPRACSAVSVVDSRPVGAAERAVLREKAHRQRQLAIERTSDIVTARRREGLFFDEILERLAKEDRPCP